MEQYASRRRRFWTLLVQMDPGIHLSEGRRSGMLLDLSGLKREERGMVQAPISIERDFDSVAEALIIQHPRVHLRESQIRTKEKGRDGSKRGDNSSTRWFRGTGKSANSGASAYYANLSTVEDHVPDDDMNESTDADQAHNDPIQLTQELTTEKKFWTMMTMRKTTRFLRVLLWMILRFSRELNWMRLLFLPTRGTMILTLK